MILLLSLSSTCKVINNKVKSQSFRYEPKRPLSTYTSLWVPGCHARGWCLNDHWESWGKPKTVMKCWKCVSGVKSLFQEMTVSGWTAAFVLDWYQVTNILTAFLRLPERAEGRCWSGYTNRARREVGTGPFAECPESYIRGFTGEANDVGIGLCNLSHGFQID